VFQCEAFGRSLHASRLIQLKRPDGKVTRPDARGLPLAYMATHILVTTRFFFLCVFVPLSDFFVGYCIISPYFVLLCISLFSPGTFSILVILFKALIVGIYNIVSVIPIMFQLK